MKTPNQTSARPGSASSRFLQQTLRAAQFTALALLLTLLGGCVGPAVRHEVRQDRRGYRDDRRDYRQDDRHDRRDYRRAVW